MLQAGRKLVPTLLVVGVAYYTPWQARDMVLLLVRGWMGRVALEAVVVTRLPLLSELVTLMAGIARLRTPSLV